MNADTQDLEDEIMCPCSGVTRGEIRQFFEDGLDIEAISRKTGAVSGCAGCEWDIQSFLNTLTEQKNG